MDDVTRTQVVLAAVTAAGPTGEDEAGWLASVHEQAARITAMCSPTSSLAKTIESVERSKVFTATVLSCTKEKSSTRGLVTLRTRPSKFHPDGVETARTERTDTGGLGLAMARRLRLLTGHRVAVWIDLEKIEDGAREMRLVRHVEDLGIDETAGEVNGSVPADTVPA